MIYILTLNVIYGLSCVDKNIFTQFSTTAKKIYQEDYLFYIEFYANTWKYIYLILLWL